MSVRSASRGSPAAKSIRLALRTSSIVATRSASFVRWVLRCFGRRCLSSELTLSAISVMPFIMCFQGPPGLEPLNHTPLPHVNSLASKLMDGKVPTLKHPLIFYFGLLGECFDMRDSRAFTAFVPEKLLVFQSSKNIKSYNQVTCGVLTY